MAWELPSPRCTIFDNYNFQSKNFVASASDTRATYATPRQLAQTSQRQPLRAFENSFDIRSQTKGLVTFNEDYAK